MFELSFDNDDDEFFSIIDESEETEQENLDIALLRAAKTSDSRLFSNLLEKGANPNACYRQSKRSVLHILTEKSEVTMAVRLFMESGVEIDIRDIFAYTPIHLACMLRKFKMVKLLLKNNANINCLTRNLKTPLILAIAVSAYEITYFLIKRGATLNHADVFANSPLSLAAIDLVSVPLTRFLLRKGCDPCFTPEGYMPVFLEAVLNCNSFLDLMIVKCFVKQLKNPQDINIIDERNGKTCLHYAILLRNFDLIDYLLEIGADPNIEDSSGCTPMQLVLENQYWDLAKLFPQERIFVKK